VSSHFRGSGLLTRNHGVRFLRPPSDTPSARAVVSAMSVELGFYVPGFGRDVDQQPEPGAGGDFRRRGEISQQRHAIQPGGGFKTAGVVELDHQDRQRTGLELGTGGLDRRPDGGQQ
jgi:hypothetical protein